MEDSTLKNKAINGFQWGLIDNLANSGITFVIGLVLANLLSPEEFGILAIVVIFVNLSASIIDGGFARALIRKVEADDKDYNTVFYSNLATSLALMCLFIVCAPWVASFFHQPILAEIMPVMSVILLFNAGQMIHKTLLIKALDFRSQAIASFIASVCSGIVGIAMAIVGFGIWSLVCQQMSRQFLLLLCLWILNKWRPRRIFSKACFKDLFGFSIKLLIADLINSIYKDIFFVVIGKFYSAKDLGYYNRSDQFNLIFSNSLSMVIQRVTLPVLSQFQDDLERFRHVFRKFSIYSAMITFPLVFFLAAAAEPVIILLVGEKWRPSVEYLQIMSLYGAIYPLQVLNINILNVLKRSDYILKLEIIKKCVFFPVILIGIFTSLKAMIWAAVVYYHIEFFMNSWYSKRMIGYSTLQQVWDLKFVYLASMVISLVVWAVTLLPLSYWVMLLLQIIISCLLYITVYSVFKYPEYFELKDICVKQIRNIVAR